ncbi:Winged helix-like DNA-binding domain superfamily [Sesbania bispinosa]|nr:Winged helix-like DNA-binding domain superfamily [Sesbania bispinosa]
MAPPSLESNTKLANGEDRHLNAGIEKEEDDGLMFGMQMMGSFVIPMALRSAIDLGVFDILAKAGEGAKLSAKDIALQIGTKNPEAPIMLDRLLRMLASHSLLHCSVPQDPQSLATLPQRFYSLSHGSKYFVTDADGVSLGPTMALVVDRVFYQSWSELKGAIVEGGVPFNRVYGMHAFEYPSFEDVTKLVDVGGGLGINLKLITSKYPHLKAINFDLPHVVQHAPVYAGVEHVGGDMFESVPTGDAVFMKWILHDWSDEHCLKLLKNCYKAVPDDGKVIVVDSILPIEAENTAIAKNAFVSDLLMMTQNPGGKERTQQEFMELAKGSGYSGIRFVCCVSGLWVMEFFK